MKKIILISLLLFFSQSFTLVANNLDVYQETYEFFFGDLVLSETTTQNDLYKDNIKIKEDLKIIKKETELMKIIVPMTIAAILSK